MNDKQMTNSYLMNLQNQRAGELKHIENIGLKEKYRKEDKDERTEIRTESNERSDARYKDQKEQWEKKFGHEVGQDEIRNSQTERQIDIQEQKIKANNKLFAARAVLDDGFVKAHPEYFRTTKVKDYGGAEHLEPTRKPNIDDSALALAYERYLEEKEKKAATAAANAGLQNNMTWPVWQANTPAAAPLGPVNGNNNPGGQTSSGSWY
jgi:hypothetical protein